MSKIETVIFEKNQNIYILPNVYFHKYLFNAQYFAGTLLGAKRKEVYLFPKS